MYTKCLTVFANVKRSHLYLFKLILAIILVVFTSKTVPDSIMESVLRKGVFPKYKSKLTNSDISIEDYHHALREWDDMDMKTLGQYLECETGCNVLVCFFKYVFLHTVWTLYIRVLLPV